MLQYLLNNGEKVTLDAVDKPDKRLTKFEDPLNFGLEHEQYITSLINDIYAAANKAKDFRTMQFLDWFVREQGEEEKNAEDLIKKFGLFGSDPKGLYMVRTYLLQYDAAAYGVESRSRLVEYEHLGLHRYYSGYRRAALLSAGELKRRSIELLFVDSDRLRGRAHTAVDLGLVQPHGHCAGRVRSRNDGGAVSSAVRP